MKKICIVLSLLFLGTTSVGQVYGSATGEGTGHQRVVEILGYPVPESKVHLIERTLPSRTRQLSMGNVRLIVLKSEDVIKLDTVEKMNFMPGPSIFGNLKSLSLRNGGEVSKSEIMAVVTK